MSEALRKGQPDEPDGDADAADAERFPREFRRNTRGGLVKMIAIQAGWEPGSTLNVPADELSALLIRMRRGEIEEEADEQSRTEG